MDTNDFTFIIIIIVLIVLCTVIYIITSYMRKIATKRINVRIFTSTNDTTFNTSTSDTIDSPIVPTIVPRIIPTIVPRIVPTIVPRIVPTIIPRIVPTIVPKIVPIVSTSTTDTIIPIVTELKFGNKVVPKPFCPYGQVYNDIANKCLCPKKTQALINNKCVEVKCDTGFVLKKAVTLKTGHHLRCINSTGDKFLISVNNLDVKK
jgi:hypothetical protein